MYNASYARAGGQSDWQKTRGGGGLPKPRFWGSREQRMRHVSLACMHAHVTLLHAWHVRTPKGSCATPKTTYARKRGMPHATMPKTAFPHVRVSEDTVAARQAKDQRGQAGLEGIVCWPFYEPPFCNTGVKTSQRMPACPHAQNRIRLLRCKTDGWP